MTKVKKPIKKNTACNEKLLKTVTVQLNSSLGSLKQQLGEKKFEKRIKKAAKKLIAGIKKTPIKTKSVKAVTVKKKAVKRVVKK